MESGAPIPAPRLPGPNDPIPVRAAPSAPDEAEPPLYRRAPLTFAIIAVNVAVFVGQTLVARLGGLAVMPNEVLLAFGANNVNATVYEHRYDTLVTSCFVHASLLHIAFNMVALRQIGPFVERTVGAARMAPLYLLAGIAGSTGSAFFGWLSGAQRTSVGASGAICGLIGATLVIGYRIEGRRSPIMFAMAKWLATLFALGLFVTFLVHLGGGGGGFDNAAHASGAFAGASIAVAWRRGETYPASTTVAVVALCTCVVVSAGVLTARYTLNDPFATLSADARLAYAANAIDVGRCRDARAALSSLEKLVVRRAPEIRLIEQNYHHRCGP
jgi:rhomboid protease GluP